MSKGELDLLKISRKADLNVQVLIKIQTYRERKTKRVIFVHQIFFYHYFSIFYLRTFFVGRAVSFSVISHGHMQVWAGGGSEWIIK